GYRYEFHIGKGASVRDQVVYRVEFTNKITPAKAPGPTDAVGGGNELLWQLTGGTETMTITRVGLNGDDDVVLGKDLPVLHNNHEITTSTDSLLRIWAGIWKQEVQVVDPSNIITGQMGFGDFVQVGRNALPLFNAGFVGTQRQGLYLHTPPNKDVTNFGADIL